MSFKGVCLRACSLYFYYADQLYEYSFLCTTYDEEWKHKNEEREDYNELG